MRAGLRWAIAAMAATTALSRACPAPAAEPAKGADDTDRKPPRPPPVPPERPKPLAWEPHGEIHAGLAVVERPVHVDGDHRPTPVRLGPGVGYTVQLVWDIFRYLRFTGYVVASYHDVTLPSGSLGQPRADTLTSPSVHAYTFGGRLSPTLPLTPRLRAWLTVGGGWGRVEYGRMRVSEPGKGAFTLRERASQVVEIPLGLGASFDLVPRWLSVQIEVTGAFVPGQVGNALEKGQAIDAGGRRRDIGPLPRLDASFVQTLGLSLLL